MAKEPNDTNTPVDSEAYRQPPAVLVRPGAPYAASTRAFQGISSLACGHDDRLWAVWYGGITPGEDHNNYVMLAVSTDRGATWSDEILVIDPDGEGPVRAFDPEVWLAPDGNLWLFWAQGMTADRRTPTGVWAITGREADGAGIVFSAPRRLCDGVMMCKPIVLSSGEWCLPVSLWHRREAGSAAMFVSADQGLSWDQRGACDVPPADRNHDEHMIVELENGRLWMLVRTNYGIGESLSVDGGRSWSALQPSGIPHPASRFFIRRLQSGRLLLVRHDPGEGKVADGESKGVRSHLTAFLSEDDGRSWPHRLLLDERTSVSYPDGDQAGDGTLYVTYDFQRRDAREILMVAFCEEDVLRGGDEAAANIRRALISKASR